MKVELMLVVDLPQARDSLTPIEVGSAIQRVLQQADFQLAGELRAIGATWGTNRPDYTTRVISAQERTA